MEFKIGDEFEFSGMCTIDWSLFFIRNLESSKNKYYLSKFCLNISEHFLTISKSNTLKHVSLSQQSKGPSVQIPIVTHSYV